MSTIGGTPPRPAAAPFVPPARAAQEAKLRETARQLEGVFVTQMLQAMRATVPDDGLTSGGFGEGTFRDMLDQHLAELWPARMDGPHSLTDALYRQLRGRLPGAAGGAPPSAPNGASAPAEAETDSKADLRAEPARGSR